MGCCASNEPRATGSTPSHGNPASTSALNTELNNVARNTDDTAKARALVARGADLASTNGPHWRHTPLHQAAYHGRYEMAKTLVELGAPLDGHSNPCGRGATGIPLELARGGGHTKIAEMLDKAMKGERSNRGGERGVPGPDRVLRASEVRKFTFTSNGKRYGICLGALGDRIHDPYRCNGGGVEGEYGQANQLVVCSPEKATTLFWSQQYPHVNKLLINDQRRRCINVHWWKLVEGTACSIYDAYPTGPATGQKWIINSDGSISQHEKRHLVLGLANHHSGWDVVKLVKAGAPSAILLDSPAPAAAFEGKLDGEWVGDYHEYGKERVRIDYVASESGTTICATKITGDHIVAAGMVTWEVPMGSTKGRANCGQHGWCDGDLIIRGPDHIAFRWPIWKTVEYKRAENYSPPLSGYNEDRGGCDIKVRYQRVTEPEEHGEGSGGGSGTEVTKPTALTEPTCPKCARTIIYWRNDLWTCDVCSKQMTPGSAGTWWCPTKTDGCDWGCCKSCYETLSGRLFNADGTEQILEGVVLEMEPER